MKIIHNVSIFIAVAITMVSCKGMAKEFQTIAKLQDTLSKRYETKEINVKIMNGKIVFVSFVNSRFDSLQPSEKQRMAYEIGEITLKTLGKENKIESGSLLFVEKKSYSIVSTSRSVSFDMKLDSLAKVPLNDSIQKSN